MSECNMRCPFLAERGKYVSLSEIIDQLMPLVEKLTEENSLLTDVILKNRLSYEVVQRHKEMEQDKALPEYDENLSLDEVINQIKNN